jgi:hypothetical protein
MRPDRSVYAGSGVLGHLWRLAGDSELPRDEILVVDCESRTKRSSTHLHFVDGL